MSQELHVKINGLYTYPSDLSAVPEGALSIADNIVINRDSIAEPRRGLDVITHGANVKSAFSDSSYKAKKIFFYKDYILSHYDSALAYHDATLGWVPYSGSFVAPSSGFMRSTQSNQNFYYTTSGGVYKLDGYDATPKPIGAAPALDAQAAISASAYTWLPDKFRTAYRVVWGYKDNNQNLILGSPSAREAITNTAGSAKAIDLTFTIPNTVTTAYFYQLYRSAAVDNTSVVIEPNDELQLVYEGNPTAGNISDGYVTVTDITPDSLRGAALYTNASQEGLGNANELPPLAQDLAVFRNCMFYGNTSSIQNLTVNLLGSGAPNGLVVNDTITIAGHVYTAKATETIANAEFKVFAVTGGETAGMAIRDTALSLCRVINRHANSLVYAYYLSGLNDLPGQIYFSARSAGQVAFTCVVSRPSAWTLSSSTSVNDTLKNAVFFSKISEPEAVPLANYLLIGDASKEIKRIIALRDSLFVIKDDGIFRVYGTQPSDFQAALLDNTAVLISPESCATLNNQIYALTTMGIVAISDTAVKIMSHQIEADLTNLITYNYSTLKNTSFGVAYESARAYYLFCISGASDTTPSQYYRYNYITNTWTRGIMSKTCGGVNPTDDKLYLGNALLPLVDVERKGLNYTDYADYVSTQTITNVSTVNLVTTITMTGSDTVTPGSVIYQDANTFGTVASINLFAGTITFQGAVAFVNGAADVLSPIICEIGWIPFSFVNPGYGKQLREVNLLFKSDFNNTAQVEFVSDVSPTISTETINGSPTGGWGLFPWGLALWGGSNRRRPIRVMVPRNHMRSSLLTVRFKSAFAFSPWQLQGISIIGIMTGERTGN